MSDSQSIKSDDHALFPLTHEDIERLIATTMTAINVFPKLRQLHSPRVLAIVDAINNQQYVWDDTLIIVPDEGESVPSVEDLCRRIADWVDERRPQSLIGDNHGGA